MAAKAHRILIIIVLSFRWIINANLDLSNKFWGQKSMLSNIRQRQPKFYYRQLSGW